MNWTAIAGIVGTLLGVLITQLFTSKREKRRLNLEEKRFDIEHPNIFESEIKCKFHGPFAASLMAVISLYINNRSYKQLNISSVRLGIRGIDMDARGFSLLGKEGEGRRIFFPTEIVKEELLNSEYCVIEGGQRRELTFVTVIPIDTQYIRVNTVLFDKSQALHSLERIFEVSKNKQDRIIQIVLNDDIIS